MKMYVWDNPYPVAYGGSACFVVAETVEDAIRVACERTEGFGVYLGHPNRVYDLPCAEWYEWSE